MKTAYFLPVLLLSAFCKAQGPYPYTEKGKWGLTDKNKNVLLKPQFDSIDVFRNGYARVESSKRVGLINTSGTIVVAPSYFQIANAWQDGTGIARNIKGYVIIDVRADKVISTLFFDALPEKSNYTKGSFYFVQKDGKMGIFDATGVKMIPCKNTYEQITGFNDPALAQYAVVTEDGKLGVIDILSGRELLKPAYDYIDEVYAGNTVYLSAKIDDKTTYYDAGFHTATPGDVKEKQAIPPVEDGSAMVNKRAKDMYIYKLGNDKWRVVLENRERSKPVGLDSTSLNGYSELAYLSYSATDKKFPAKIKAVKNGKAGVIDMNGNILVPFEYDDIIFREDMVGRYAFLETVSGGQKGVVVAATMTELKKPVLKAVLDEDHDRNALLVELPNGQKGYMDKTSGEIFIPGVK